MRTTGAGRISRRSPPWITEPISLRLDDTDGPEISPDTPIGRRPQGSEQGGKARALTNILAAQSVEMRAKGEALIQQADKLLCESWNERMWSDGDPSRDQVASAWRSVIRVNSEGRPSRSAKPGHSAVPLFT
jgi:hypothetical protein